MSNERQVNKEEEKKSQRISTLDGVVTTCPGSDIAYVYKKVYDKELDCNVIKKVDETNLREFIQSSKSQTDLSLLQKRFLELGEIPSSDPNYDAHDLSMMPNNIHEVYDMVNNVDANFNKLPQSVKDIFGSRDAYLKAIMDGTYQATLVNAFNQMNKAKEEQPKPNEEQKKEGDK